MNKFDITVKELKLKIWPKTNKGQDEGDNAKLAWLAVIIIAFVALALALDSDGQVLIALLTIILWAVS